ncbi:hypothetical protein GYM75_01760 [Gilliamella sp. ESL0441]|uniref:hypothetical protein n=1 Tax=Gilliamella sp. ESL0441 TaxID=2704654 RepID=UPI001C69AB99|nr:hypothetical protein [Gilliamella sp. ESL0441]QYN43649.1 hypothetical protein GYM75_01760 [Gilliamella sp. ESL0441]
MQKIKLPFIAMPLIALISTNTLALNCGDNITQNQVEANNYIFQLYDYIETSAKGVKQEIRTIVNTKTDEPAHQTTAHHTLDYDPEGLILLSHYELYSDQNKQLYSEHLQKINTGWENIIEDFEDKTNSITQFTTDKEGKIIQSHQVKKAVDFIFIQNDSYQYDNNNCLINKRVQWQLKETDKNSQYTGKDLSGASSFVFEYQDQKLAKMISQFSNGLQKENNYSYQYDNNQLTTIQSNEFTNGKESANYLIELLTFNDKHDWLSASKVNKFQENKQSTIIRKITYF